jgi:hypothetical protein
MTDEEPHHLSLPDLIAHSRNLRMSSKLWLWLVQDTLQTLEHLLKEHRILCECALILRFARRG